MPYIEVNCAAIPEGGTTPSYGEILQARRLLTSTRQHVIIRPRGGDFVYSALEIERMITDIKICREIGVDGVVFGCLTPEGDVDEATCRQLLEAAEGMQTTFHRAFDRCRNPQEALKRIISMGFHRILTSGQQPSAEQGIELLKSLNEQAAGRIIIMAGCGVNEDNILHIQQATGISEFHFSAREPLTDGDSEFGTRMVTTERRVRNTIEKLLSRK